MGDNLDKVSCFTAEVVLEPLVANFREKMWVYLNPSEAATHPSKTEH